MTLDKAAIVERLQVLERSNGGRGRFGSIGHQYRLNDPLPATVIDEFEREHGIALPEDYKQFITSIGNGGAGPYYGLLPFGQYDGSGDDLCPWDDGLLVGNVAEPFPYVEAWNLPASFWDAEPDPPPGTPQEEEDRMMEAWDRALEEHYWNPKIVNGAIPICHRGCALRQWLVVNGPQKGFVWNDDRADYGGLSPLRDSEGNQVTFSSWYSAWLATPPTQHVSIEDMRKRIWQSAHSVPHWAFAAAVGVGAAAGFAVTLWRGWRGWIAVGVVAALALTVGLDRLLIRRRRRRPFLEHCRWR